MSAALAFVVAGEFCSYSAGFGAGAAGHTNAPPTGSHAAALRAVRRAKSLFAV